MPSASVVVVYGSNVATVVNELPSAVLMVNCPLAESNSKFVTPATRISPILSI